VKNADELQQEQLTLHVSSVLEMHVSDHVSSLSVMDFEAEHVESHQRASTFYALTNSVQVFHARTLNMQN
jgi:hypothetical protein